MRAHPIDVTCGYCHAEPGKACRRPKKRGTQPHARRIVSAREASWKLEDGPARADVVQRLRVLMREAGELVGQL